MTELLLVRHGETEDNVRQIMQGQTHGRLTAHGRQQAEALAQQLSSKKIDVLVSSDLQRAIDTAVIIGAPHHLPLVTTPLLRERDWGGFTGRFIPDLKDEKWPDDVETMAQLMARSLCRLLRGGGGTRHHQQSHTGRISQKAHTRSSAYGQC